MARRRWWIGVLSVVVVLTIAAGVAWYAQSGLVRWLLIRQLDATTNRPTTIERVDLRLAEGRLDIVGLRIADREPGPPLAELGRVEARFDPRALLRGRVAIGEITVRGVSVRIVRSESGVLNISDLLTHGAGRGSADVTIDHLTLADAHVSLEDRTRTPVQHWRADDITVELRGLSTRPARDPGFARIAATVAGAPISAEISELRLAPLELRGHLAVKDADATLAGVYLPADVTAMIERARLTADVTVAVDPSNGIGVDAQGRLDALVLRHRRTGDALASAPSFAFAVNGARADAAGRVSTLGRIEVTGAGTLFDARGAAAGRLDLERLRLSVEDASASAPSSAQVTVTAAFGGGGKLDVQGPLRLHPLGAELRARLAGLNPTVPLSYVDLPAQVSGVVDSDLTVDLASASGGVSSRIRGRTTVHRAVVADGGREILRVRQIDVDGVDAQWPRVAIARVRVAQPVALVERDQAGRVSVAALVPPAPPGARGSSAARTSSAVTVEVDEIAVDDGAVTLEDATAAPPARLTFTRLRANARHAAWPARRPVSIDVQVTTPGAGTLEAKGTVSLDPVRIDIRARLAGAALAPYQGYVPFPARIQGLAHLDVAVVGSLGPTIAITAKGTGALSDLTMADGDRRVLRVTRVETTGLDYTWPATLTVDRLYVGRSRVRLERRADGTFPLLALFTRSQRAERAPDGATHPAISVSVRDAVLEDGGVRFVDESVGSTAGVDVSAVRLVARGFTWPARVPLPIELRAATPGGGRVSVNGTLDLAAAGLDAKVALNDVDVTPARPYLPVRARVAARASANLDVKARLDPLAITARGSASLGDVTIGDGDRPIITASRVETTGVDYTWPSTVAMDRLRVQTARALVERARDGTFPLVGLVTPARETSGVRPEPASTARPLEVTIRESVLDDGSATMTDGAVSPAARIDVTAVRLVARDFAWPARGPASVRMRAALPGGGNLRARGLMALAPKTLDLDVTLEGADLALVRPYLPLRGRVAGKAGADLKVSATAEPLAITARGAASLSDLAVSDGERRLLTADRVELSALDYAWPATVSIDRLRVQKPWALIDRVSGQLPVLAALTSPAPGAPRHDPRATGAGATGPAAAVQLNVRRTVAEGGAASIVDASVNPPARVDITDARLTLRDFSWPPRGASGFVLRAATPSGGSLEARGQLRLDTPAIDTKLVLERADLAAFQALVPVQGRMAGKATADLQIKGPLTPMALSINGQLTVADGSFGDAERALVTAKRVELAGVAAQWPRRVATIQRIGIREPWALVERDASGAFPLLALIAPKPASGGAPSAPGATTGAPSDGAARIEVSALVVEEGFVRFTDGTTRPRFVEEASRLAVTARGLGTAPATRSEIVIDARLTGGAKVEMRGTVGALGGPLVADLQGKVSSLALNHVNPYINGLLGWVAREGSVGGTTRFRIRDDHLEAENEFVIGQPLFVPSRQGDEVRKRVGVPLDLLVSLLENARREVHLSVPVTGTLSSRQFDFGDAMWDAIRKVAINVLALPVSWVGKIFYTADSRIDTISIWPVSFEPGTTRMRRGIDAHAARLATFMRQTPSMAFTLKPVMTVEDVDALKREAVRQRIDTLARDAGSPEAAAARLYAERFPSRPVPAELAAMVDELAKAEPLPDSALRTLANARVSLIRQELEAKGGVNPTRLRTSEGPVPVEATGHGRVEFEMTPEAVTSR